VKVGVERHGSFDGIYWLEAEGERHLATKNLAPGVRVYGERLYDVGGEEYRLWSPHRSKLAASILRGITRIFIGRGSRVLYLGVSTGTTASHVSDIIGREGILFGVDFSPTVMLQFKRNVQDVRSNVVSILADARNPSAYRHLVGKVDTIYSDVAQPEQARLVSSNAAAMLTPGGGCLVAIKARSVNSVEKPSRVYERELEVLKKSGFDVLEKVVLEPFDKDHIMVACTQAR